MPKALEPVLPHISLFRDAVNVYVLQFGDGSMCLFDFGSGAVLEAMAAARLPVPQWVFHTDYRRDRVFGHHDHPGLQVAIGEHDAPYMAEASQRWQDLQVEHGYADYHRFLMPRESIPVARTVRDGELVIWSKPYVYAQHIGAHTPGGMGYLVVDGERLPHPPAPSPAQTTLGRGGERLPHPLAPSPAQTALGRGGERQRRYLVCGDLIQADGTLHSIFELQRNYNFMEGLHAIRRAAGWLASGDIDAVLPSHGDPIIGVENVVATAQVLLARLADFWERWRLIWPDQPQGHVCDFEPVRLSWPPGPPLPRSAAAREEGETTTAGAASFPGDPSRAEPLGGTDLGEGENGSPRSVVVPPLSQAPFARERGPGGEEAVLPLSQAPSARERGPGGEEALPPSPESCSEGEAGQRGKGEIVLPHLRGASNRIQYAIADDSGNAVFFDTGVSYPDGYERLLADKGITNVDVVFITHHHDDHVMGYEWLREHFGARLATHECMVDVLQNPRAYALNCLHDHPLKVDIILREGEAYEWRGYRITAHHFPSQTEYHAAYFAEVDGVMVLFSGDALYWEPGCERIRPTDPDWRNRFDVDRGYLVCAPLLTKYQPRILAAAHVHPWTISGEACAAFAENARAFHDSLRALVGRRHATLGIDPFFVSIYPYRATLAERVLVEVRIGNALDREAHVTMTPRLTEGISTWPEVLEVDLEPKVHARIPLTLEVGQGARMDQRLLWALRVVFDGEDLGEFCEGILEPQP